MKDIGWTRSNNFSAARFLFVLFALLVSSFHAPAVRAEITGAWTINGSTSASTTLLGITITQTGSGGPTDGVTENYANDTLTTTTSYWSNPYSGTVAGGASLVTTIGNQQLPRTITITFSEPVNNPVLHVDRIGGYSTTSNSARWTLTSSVSQGGTVSLSRLSGNPQFQVVGSYFQRATGATITNPVGECTAAATGTGAGMACGSVQFVGTGITSLTFSVSMEGNVGIGDGMEFRWSLQGSTVVVRKQSVGATGTFSFAGTNGVGSSFTLNTASANPATSSTYTVTNHAQPITITETVPGGYSLAASCVDPTSAAVASSLSGGTLTIAPANYGANQRPITCTFVNSLLPTVQVTKVSQGGTGAFSFTGTNGYTAHTIVTTAPGTGVAGPVRTLTAAGTQTVITEAPTAGYTLTAISCTGLGPGGTATPDLAAGTVTLNAAATAGGSAIQCTFTNTRQPTDLVTVKTKTSSVPVANGGQVTFNIQVTNNGPGPATGVSLTDQLPAGFAFVSATPTAGTYNSGTGVWTIGDMANGASQTLTLVATVSGTPGSTLTNTTTAAVGGQTDPSTAGDDLTEQVIIADPVIVVDKVATPTSYAAVGEVIDYTVTVTNSGNVTLSDIAVDDPLTGLATTIASLAPGASTSFATSHTIVQADLDAGEVVNVATATGEDPAGGAVSDDGTATVTAVTAPELTVEKVATPTTYATVGEVIDYTVTVTNSGNVTLTAIAVDDPLTGLATTIASLAPGASSSFATSHAIVQADLDAGAVVNVATATGEDPAGGPVSGDGTATVTAAAAPALTVEKVATPTTYAAVGEVIDYTVTVTNSGNVTLTAIAVDDPLTGLATTIASLAPGASASFATSHAIVQADLDAGAVVNVATATGEDPAGGAVTDDGTATVTAVTAPALTVEKVATLDDLNGNGLADTGETIGYAVTVTNSGNVTLDDLVVMDSFNGGAPVALSCTPTSLDPGDEVACAAYAHVVSAGDLATGVLSNTATAMAMATTGVLVEASATVLVAPGAVLSDITVEKVAGLRQVRRGEHVPYTIRVTNNSTGAAAVVDVIDRIPSGFRYVEGSGSVDAVASDPAVAGLTLTFAGVTVAPGQTVEVRLQLLVLSTVSPGIHVNYANALGPDGNPVGPDARAQVEVASEAVFDCSEIIGRVFDDLNRNGYQDDGEPGLPGVRLATARGLLVTTDAHGRYHVPCAALPDRRIGSNFIMKLDTRTLPTGYRLTTENPRVVRLTAGKMTELDFGASVGRVVRLDLEGGAFEAGSTALTTRWREGLDQLVTVLGEEQSVLRLSYVDASTGHDLARSRMRAIEDEIRRLWKARGGRYRLDIETRVEAGR